MLYSNSKNLPLTTEITVKGNMGLGGCDLMDLVKEYGTPLYVIDEETLRDNCRKYLNSFHVNYPETEVIFASKAMSVQGVLKIIKEEGLGIDVVSGGELYAALKAGFAPEKIYFHGNNKSRQELTEAVEAKIGTVILDSFTEAQLLNEIAVAKGIKQKVLLRVTPGIEAHTHDFVKTGHFDSKFGVHIELVPDTVAQLKKLSGLEFAGIHVHIGSQILEVNPFAFTVERMLELIQKLDRKVGVKVNTLNLGGGLGICYISREVPPSIEEYAQAITKELNYRLKKLGILPPKLIVEPGRSIVGNAGVTLYTVGVIKEIKSIRRKYVAVDGGMADNPRPITYQAKYEALVVNKPSAKKNEIVTIAGKFCESGDILIKDIVLPSLEMGDVLAVLGTGAYNYSMSSNYNMTPRPAMVLVGGGKHRLLVKRETYEDLLRNQF